jgi:endonuclease/exonuclease/phosphatase family metal-dependent hydrolase
MKIVSYNILTGGAINCGDRRDQIINTLKEINDQKCGGKGAPIEVLALQEANEFDTENKEFMLKIKEELGFEFAYVSDAVKFTDGRRYNTAIYSRYQLKEIHDFYEEIETAGICGVIETEKYGKVGILSLHLSTKSEDERLKELDIMLSYMKKFDKQIVMGDFNAISKRDNYIAEEMDEGMAKETDAMAKCKKLSYVDSIGDFFLKDNLSLEDLRTYPTPTNHQPKFKNPVRIDHILLKGLGDYVKGAEIVHSDSAKLSSDHYPIWIVLD